MQVSAYGLTDVGLRRSHNEDAFVIQNSLLLFAVADGIGGAAAGEVASALFVETCQKVFSQQATLQASRRVDSAFQQANRAILDHVQLYPETKGMGCTAELLTFDDDHFVIGHVGDSRSYLLRNGELVQLTRDHSFIQEQIERGEITPEQAKTHWLRNAINRAVGQGEDLTTDLLRQRAESGDRLLLCSDGLSDMLSDEEIQHILASDDSLQQRVCQLINAANAKGGRDNITVLVCEVN